MTPGGKHKKELKKFIKVKQKRISTWKRNHDRKGWLI